MAHELKCGGAVLLLREEEHGQEPCRQRQLGGGEDRPGGDRGLVVAVTILMCLILKFLIVLIKLNQVLEMNFKSLIL